MANDGHGCGSRHEHGGGATGAIRRLSVHVLRLVMAIQGAVWEAKSAKDCASRCDFGQAALGDLGGALLAVGVLPFQDDRFRGDLLEEESLFGGGRRQGEGGAFLDLELLPGEPAGPEVEDGRAVVSERT